MIGDHSLRRFNQPSNLTSNSRLPYLHKNARSRQITTREIREVFASETSRFLPHGIDRNEYLRKVMP